MMWQSMASCSPSLVEKLQSYIPAPTPEMSAFMESLRSPTLPEMLRSSLAPALQSSLERDVLARLADDDLEAYSGYMTKGIGKKRKARTESASARLARCLRALGVAAGEVREVCERMAVAVEALSSTS